MPEEIPDRALAQKIDEYHGGQHSALYAIASCIRANERGAVNADTVTRGVKELRDFATLDGGYMMAEAADLADALERWGKRYHLSPFIIAYIDAALWSSSCNETENDDTPLSDRYSMADIDSLSMDRIVKECEDFIGQCKPEDLELQRDDQNGHDFWLSRNGHGAGFFDRGLGDAGDRLQEIARGMGESDIYVGDDKKLYVS